MGGADTTDIDLDALWETTIWEEIDEIIEVKGEVEQVITAAGVRGAEAEDEALEHLYYRKSMKKLTKLDLQQALGKLIFKKDVLEKNNKNTSKVDKYISQLKYKLKKI